MAKVLIIDDDVHIAQLLQTHLQEEGFEVVIKHRGEEGIKEAQTLRPDVIMLDVMLPDVTGFQICRRLRQNSPTQTTPIIMMTGVARYPNQQVYALERGANEYLIKPFKILEVGELVHTYVRPDPK